MMMCGLQERDMKLIREAISQFNNIDCAIIFGSRALGNYKKGSDVDLALKGDFVSDETILKLNNLLNEIYPLPYYFDILHYEGVRNEQLKTHIDRYGIPVWEVDGKKSNTN